MPVLADTGCQACVMGPEELRKLGLSEKDLLPVDMKLHGANGSNIQILGAIFIIISGRDAERKTWETHHLHLDEARNHPQNISYCWQLC